MFSYKVLYLVFKLMIMKEFIYSVVAGEYEYSGTIFKNKINEVYLEIYKLIEDIEFKNIKILIEEK